jgi:NAD(P)-dependent dehydrogenase (short-subunit alcohol dehydrogenase family)
VTTPAPAHPPPLGTGTRVLVTGAASGLGAALVALLRGRGAQVLATDVRAETGWETPEDDVLRRLDVTSDEDWSAAAQWVAEHWGGLDVLINNAGVAGGGRIDRATLEEWRWIFDVNLYGAVRGVRAFTPMLKSQGSGRIVNVASLAALVHPAGMGSYNAVKAALLALTETIGHELAAYGVRAHAVCPSYFRTALMDSLQGADEAVGQVMAELVTSAPLGADEVAGAVLAGIEAEEELILPDPAARAAYRLKSTDRAAYDEVMRAQARKLDAVAHAAAHAADHAAEHADPAGRTHADGPHEPQGGRP